MVYAEEKDPQNFERLKSLVLGSIITTILKRDNFNIDMKLSRLKIYLDTNVVISLLGYDDPSGHKAAVELIKLLQQSGCELYIFSFTKDEVTRLLNAFIQWGSEYPAEAPVNSLFVYLNKLGLSAQDIQIIINNLDRKFQELGLLIDHNFDTTITPENAPELETLSGYKTYSRPSGLLHDISALFSIRKLRRGSVSILERSTAIFLTQDSRLYQYNYENWGHKINQPKTVPEAIKRDFLISLLWLKQPQTASDLPIHNIIAGCKANLLASKATWDRFLREVGKQKSAGTISEDDISDLISNNETKLLLTDMEHGKVTDSDLTRIIPQVVSDEHEKRKKIQTATKDQTDEINRTKSDIEDLLGNSASTLKQAQELYRFNAAMVEETELRITKNVVFAVKWSLSLLILVVLCVGTYFAYRYRLFTIPKNSNPISYLSLPGCLVVYSSVLSALTKKNFIPKSVADKLPQNFNPAEWRIRLESLITQRIIIYRKSRTPIISAQQQINSQIEAPR
ncbi:hypothetical protein IPG36_05345 [bacterium]|nr:MAG: hypothetical protein IPG36_05345 [bacterium]